MTIGQNDVMDKVEQMVCSCVNVVMRLGEREEVDCEEVYAGKKNIPTGRAMARNFIFDVLHNRYGFSFSVIAQRGDCNRESVMRCVRKCHDLVLYDKSYGKVNEMINDKLREWYGE